jgi:hypothetical protein
MEETMNIPVERIASHWAKILKWLRARPKTVRYDSDQDRAALCDDTLDAVAGIRSELARLCLTETEDQKLARKEREKKLRASNKALSRRRIRFFDGFLALIGYRPEPTKDPIESLLNVDHLPWPVPRDLKIDALMAEIDAMPKAKKKNSKSYKPDAYVLSEKPGITNFDVFNVFGLDARVILAGEEIKEALGDSPGVPAEPAEPKSQPGACEHCEGNPHAKIVKRTWANGKRDWACHRCGRAVLIGNKILITQ